MKRTEYRTYRDINPLYEFNISSKHTTIVLYDFQGKDNHTRWIQDRVSEYLDANEISNYSSYHYTINHVYLFSRFYEASARGDLDLIVVPDMSTLLTNMGGKPFLHLLETTNLNIVAVLDDIDTRRDDRQLVKKMLEAYFRTCYRNLLLDYSWNLDTLDFKVKNARAKTETVEGYTETRTLELEENNTIVRIKLSRVVEESDHLVKSIGYKTVFYLAKHYGPFIRPDAIRKVGDNQISIVLNYYGQFRRTYEYCISDYNTQELEADIRKSLYTEYTD